MQQFAFKRTEEGIRQRQEAIRRGQAAANLQRERDAKVKELESTIAALKRQLQKLKDEPLLIKSEFRRIEERASRVFGLPIAAFKSPRRDQKMVLARQFVMYWAARRTQLSYPLIGRLMGGRDHTTVMAGRDAYPVKRAKMGRTLRAAR